MFSEVQPSVMTPGHAPVYLNVYDLTPANDYFYWAGIGIFHTGIEGIRLMIIFQLPIQGNLHLLLNS